MLKNPSLVTRIGVGKVVGFLFGLAGFLSLPLLVEDPSLSLRWGVLFWYTTVGAIIGVFGVFDRHPVLRFPMPWWIRAPIIGAWMNFVLTLFAYDSFAAMMRSMFGNQDVLSSPHWFSLEGALVGLVIGYLATRFGGEGQATVGYRPTGAGSAADHV